MTAFTVTSVTSFFCQPSTCLRIGSKLRCIRSTPPEMQSISENDFECFAKTGVNTAETMLPSSGSALPLDVPLSSPTASDVCHVSRLWHLSGTQNALDNCNHGKYTLTVSMNLPLQRHLSSQPIPGIKTLADELAFSLCMTPITWGKWPTFERRSGTQGLLGEDQNTSPQRMRSNYPLERLSSDWVNRKTDVSHDPN